MIKTTRRNFLKGTAAAGTIAAFGGQAPFFKKALGQGKKSVVWGQTEPFTSSWDPSSHTILAQIYFDYDVFGQLIRTPMSQAAPDEIVYEMATSQNVVEDGWLEYTLRKDIKFHRGQPFTAHDVKATFEYASNPERPSGTWYPGQAEVQVVDDYTCRVRGEGGSYPGSLFWFLAGFLPILSKDDIETKAIDEFPNGAGSYKFISRDGPTTILNANPDYLFGKSEIEEVVYQFVPDASTRLVSLISGELDIIERVEPEQYETLLEEDVTTSRTVSTENKYLHFRCYEPPFDDVRLRHAAAPCDRSRPHPRADGAGRPSDRGAALLGEVRLHRQHPRTRRSTSPEKLPGAARRGRLPRRRRPAADRVPDLPGLLSEDQGVRRGHHRAPPGAGLPGTAHGDGGRVVDRAGADPRRDRTPARRHRLDDRLARAQPGAQADVAFGRADPDQLRQWTTSMRRSRSSS